MSATTYPMVMALRFLNQNKEAYKDEEMREDILKKLKDGYDRMIEYEVKSGGFTWFGDGQGSDGLTAFGLRQFCEMKTVGVDVSEVMMKRNYDWLFSRRKNDGSGMFNYNT